MKKDKGFGILISVGKYAGFYILRGWSLRICLGWIAFSFFPVDGDVIVQLAAKGADATRIEKALSNLDCKVDIQVKTYKDVS